jgi:hypothetical protein
MAFEEVVGIVDQNELLRVGCRFHDRLEFVARAELVKRSADEQFGLGAIAQKVKRIGSRDFAVRRDRSDGCSDANKQFHARIGT